MCTAPLRLFSHNISILENQTPVLQRKEHQANTALIAAECTKASLTSFAFTLRAGEGGAEKCERFGGLAPVCWNGEPVQDPHHTDSRLVLGGARADGARLTLMCDSTQSSRWIYQLPPPNGPSTRSLQPILALQTKAAEMRHGPNHQLLFVFLSRFD